MCTPASGQWGPAPWGVPSRDSPRGREGAGHGAGAGSQARPQEARDGWGACRPPAPVSRGSVGRPSARPSLGEKAPVGASFGTLRSDLNPDF